MGNGVRGLTARPQAGSAAEDGPWDDAVQGPADKWSHYRKVTIGTMAKKRPRLFLIDGYSNIFRAFYAIRSLSNSKGMPTNAVYGFLNMLRKLLREESPEMVGVALDLGAEKVRTEKYAEYKANRPPTPEDLKAQIPWIRKTLEAYKIPILELLGHEADDVLGTLAKRGAEAGFDVVLVSADKDLMQLVDDHVFVFHTGREKLYDRRTVEEDYGVAPERIVDVLALKGDSVDNVPGVPGIGEKGARQLVSEFGGVEELLDRAAEVTRKSYREGLEQHREQALLSKELVTIHTDLEVAFEPERLQHEEPDTEALAEIFRELEFFSLLEELGGARSGGDDEWPAAQEIDDAAEWRRRSKGLTGTLYVTPVGPEEPLGFSVAGEEGPSYFVDLRREELVEPVRDDLAASFGEQDRSIVGHDLKEVLRFTGPETPVRAELFDTMLASYLLRSAARAHSREDLALDRLQHSSLSAADAGWGKKGQEPPLGHEPLLLYAGECVETPKRLAAPLAEELEREGMASVYREIEGPLVPVLTRMEEAGIALDGAFLDELSQQIAQEMESLEAAIYKVAGDRFNLNSPRQLGEVLFERLGYPVIKKTRKTKSYSTDQATLEELALRGYELPEKLLRYRELSKLRSTYVDVLPGLVAADGRLHTRYEQAVAATGRLSSANPNLQNIPVRTELGREIRKAFVAPAGYKLLVADYNQIELRVLAHIAQDRELLQAFRAGADIHSATAAAVFEVDSALVTADQRRAAKVINFGILYGMSAFGLARNLKIPKADAERFIKTYLARYDGVREYMESTVEQTKREGKVETLYGRVRWLPDIQSRNFNLRENARRMAINARIQGTAADLLKLAMIAVDHRLASEYPDAKLLLTVHDELVLEVPAREVDAVGTIVKAEMEGVAALDVPLIVDVGSGASWYEAKV